MKRLSAANEDAPTVQLPLTIALYSGRLTAAVVMQLTGAPLAQAQRKIESWVADGYVARPEALGEPMRVRPAIQAQAFATTTPRQRRRAFEELSRALDEPDADESEILDIARYYRAGAQFRLSIARYLSVAERRLDRGEREDAAAILAEIVATVPSRGPEMLAVFDLQAQCAIAAGDLSLAMMVLERLRRLASVCGDRFATIRALLQCADCSLLQEAFATAMNFATRALELCGPLREYSVESVTALLIAAEALLKLGRRENAAQRLNEAATQGAVRQSSTLARFHFVTGELFLPAEPRRAIAEFRAAVAAATNELDNRQALKATHALAAAYVQNADLFSAAATLRGAVMAARALRLPAMVTQLSLALVGVYYESGRFGEAQAAITSEMSAAPHPVLLRLALALNNDDLIERWGPPSALDDALASESPQLIADVLPNHAEIARRRSEGDRVEALYRRAIAVIGDSPAPADFWCAAAEFCAAAEIPNVREALDRARVDAPPLAALIVELGTILLARREDFQAAGLIDRAEAAATAFLTGGFKTWSRRARASIANVAPGGRVAAVVALIAAGYSNAEIAERLFVSKRTIEKTIGDLLKNYGVRSRWQLAHLARADSAPANRGDEQL